MGALEGESCWTSIPYASIFAMLVMLAGIGCFCGPVAIGLEKLEELLKDSTGFNLVKENEILWVGELRIVLIICGVVTGGIGILLLVFGVMATGATRRNVYSGANCILGGRCSAVFFLIITYIINIAWIVITSGMAIPVAFLLMLRSICSMEYGWQGTQPGQSGLALECFNLTRIGVYVPGFSPEFPDDYRYGPHLCEQSKLTRMCDVVAEEIPLMIVALAGSALISISLVTFLMIVSTNYQRIKTAKELTDYRDALEQDTTEMDNIITSRRQFNSSYATESVMS